MAPDDEDKKGQQTLEDRRPDNGEKDEVAVEKALGSRPDDEEDASDAESSVMESSSDEDFDEQEQDDVGEEEEEVSDDEEVENEAEEEQGDDGQVSDQSSEEDSSEDEMEARKRIVLERKATLEAAKAENDKVIKAKQAEQVAAMRKKQSELEAETQTMEEENKAEEAKRETMMAELEAEKAESLKAREASQAEFAELEKNLKDDMHKKRMAMLTPRETKIRSDAAIKWQQQLLHYQEHLDLGRHSYVAFVDQRAVLTDSMTNTALKTPTANELLHQVVEERGLAECPQPNVKVIDAQPGAYRGTIELYDGEDEELEDGTLAESVIVRVLVGIEQGSLYKHLTYGVKTLEVLLERTPLFEKPLEVNIRPPSTVLPHGRYSVVDVNTCEPLEVATAHLISEEGEKRGLTYGAEVAGEFALPDDLDPGSYQLVVAGEGTYESSTHIIVHKDEGASSSAVDEAELNDIDSDENDEDGQEDEESLGEGESDVGDEAKLAINNNAPNSEAESDRSYLKRNGTGVLAVSPAVGNKQLRIVLTWGAEPDHLDLFVQYPDGTNLSRIATKDGAVFSSKSSIYKGFGPRAIEMTRVGEGLHHIWVKKRRPGGPPLQLTGAKIEIQTFMGNLDHAVGREHDPLEIPTVEHGYWFVVAFDGATLMRGLEDGNWEIFKSAFSKQGCGLSSRRLETATEASMFNDRLNERKSGKFKHVKESILKNTQSVMQRGASLIMPK